MVERGSTPSKRLANTGSGDECHFPQDDDFHGRFGSGLGDKVGDTGNVRPLDTGGEIRINKRQRIEDDPLCTPTPCKKRPNSHINLFTDSITALKYVKKQGGTSSPTLQRLALQIHELLIQWNISIHYGHIPENAECRSRPTE